MINPRYVSRVNRGGSYRVDDTHYLQPHTIDADISTQTWAVLGFRTFHPSEPHDKLSGLVPMAQIPIRNLD